MTCREEMLIAVRQIINEKGRNEFTPKEVRDRMVKNGTKFSENTMNGELTSRLCKDAPINHVARHEDFERIRWGVYRLLL